MKKLLSVWIALGMMVVGTGSVFASENRDELRDMAEELMDAESYEDVEDTLTSYEEQIDEAQDNLEAFLEDAEEAVESFDLETFLIENEEVLKVIYENRVVIRGLEVAVVTKAYELESMVYDMMYGYELLTPAQIQQLVALMSSYEEEMAMLKQEAELLKAELIELSETKDFSAYSLETVLQIQEREIQALVEINDILDEVIDILG